MKRTAKAHWEGTLKEGKGTLSTQSGILNNTNYNFSARFEEGQKGTNPEELIAAASAGCFTMYVGAKITEKGFIPKALDTDAILNFEGGVITAIHLIISGGADGLDAESFESITKDAAKNCIVSKALNVRVTSEAKFNP
ncbi:MAG: peroxiredoxin, OsmC subfamily [Bacteroidetes bacterium]|jgi:osmotically inducible protein OsmC|nr:peroxiredoxin, OsmC subfamily [Bacteroidota bacterium]MDF2452376.1 peroxiredoxin, OsmC subfamily [Bacteroidota bacterium]